MSLPRFRKEQTLAVFIDLTEGPLSAVNSLDRDMLRSNAARFRKAMDLLEIPCIYAHAPLPDPAGRWIPEAGWEASKSVSHTTNDCFETEEFSMRIESFDRKQLLLCGVATDVGVGLTALSAVEKGYAVAVIADVSGTTDSRAEQIAFLRLSQSGVVLSSYSAMVGELQREYTKPPGPELLKLLNFNAKDWSGPDIPLHKHE